MARLYRSCSSGMRKWPVYYLSHTSFLSACGVCQHIERIKQWLLQRLFTALAVLRTSQSPRDRRKLVPDSTGNPVVRSV